MRQQDNCNRNNCYRAVWGDDANLVPVSAVLACERHLTTTEIIYPLYVQLNLTRDLSTTNTTQCYEYLRPGHGNHIHRILFDQPNLAHTNTSKRIVVHSYILGPCRWQETSGPSEWESSVIHDDHLRSGPDWSQSRL